MAEGDDRLLTGGEQVDSLPTGGIVWLEVRPDDNGGTILRGTPPLADDDDDDSTDA